MYEQTKLNSRAQLPWLCDAAAGWLCGMPPAVQTIRYILQDFSWTCLLPFSLTFLAASALRRAGC
jgi:hypothetical protein